MEACQRDVLQHCPRNKFKRFASSAFPLYVKEYRLYSMMIIRIKMITDNDYIRINMITDSGYYDIDHTFVLHKLSHNCLIKVCDTIFLYLLVQIYMLVQSKLGG